MNMKNKKSGKHLTEKTIEMLLEIKEENISDTRNRELEEMQRYKVKDDEYSAMEVLYEGK